VGPALDYTDIIFHPLYKTDGTFILLPPEYCNPISVDFDPLPKLPVGFRALPFQTRGPGFEKPLCLFFLFVFPKRLKVSLREQAMLKRVLVLNNSFATRLSSRRFSPAAPEDGQEFGGLSSLAAQKMQEKKKSTNVCPTELQTRGIRCLNNGKFGGKGGDHGR
jgi:hypothetical protein